MVSAWHCSASDWIISLRATKVCPPAAVAEVGGAGRSARQSWLELRAAFDGATGSTVSAEARGVVPGAEPQALPLRCAYKAAARRTSRVAGAWLVRCIAPSANQLTETLSAPHLVGRETCWLVDVLGGSDGLCRPERVAQLELSAARAMSATRWASCCDKHVGCGRMILVMPARPQKRRQSRSFAVALDVDGLPAGVTPGLAKLLLSMRSDGRVAARRRR